MRETANENLCGRAEDLVAYLYGEATRAEADDFEKHTQSCTSCRAELSVFGGVREAINDWRQLSLGSIVSPAIEASAPRALTHGSALAPRRKALAALREFFTLSPAWMRAATAAVALVFCALAAIAVAYFVRQPQTVVVEKQVKSGYSDEEVNRMIANAVKEEQATKANNALPQTPGEVAVKISKRAGAPAKRNASSVPQMARNNRRKQAAPRTAQPASELASADYLPFTASSEEENLPTLVDLVNDDED